jgi:hypothetical protein
VLGFFHIKFLVLEIYLLLLSGNVEGVGWNRLLRGGSIQEEATTMMSTSSSALTT